MSFPKVSFVTPMKEKDFRVIALLKSIRSQNYPQNKIEIIITDGGSNPEVLKECRKYKVKIFHNSKMLAEGAGMGKDQGIWKSTGKYVVIAESDIELMTKDWIKKMIKPLEENEEIFASAPRVFVHPKDSPTNRYLSYVGVDPFASYRSLEGQLELARLKKKRMDGYYLMELDKKRPFCMGSNGFMFRKDLIKKVGDYAQDVEFIARLAKHNVTKFAVLEDARIWHKNVKGFWDFMKKRIKWTKNYSTVYIHEKKDFEWITDRKEFYLYIIKNMTFAANIPIAIKKAVEYKDSAWLLHPFFMYISTALNIYFSLTSKKMLKQAFS
ncbi:glycosyltransferase [Candidatus Pacearchaeota archaeon]|nr:glycosyltransferase [Candidatus Pacearchaeota archaeon]